MPDIVTVQRPNGTRFPANRATAERCIGSHPHWAGFRIVETPPPASVPARGGRPNGVKPEPQPPTAPTPEAQNPPATAEPASQPTATEGCTPEGAAIAAAATAEDEPAKKKS